MACVLLNTPATPRSGTLSGLEPSGLQYLKSPKSGKHGNAPMSGCALPRSRKTHRLKVILGRVPWRTNVWAPAAEADRAVTKISLFAQLLSDDLLAERHIDAFTTYLNVGTYRVKPSAPGIFVADLSLSHLLSITTTALDLGS